MGAANSLNFSATGGGFGDDYRFVNPGWVGLQLIAGATVDVGAGTTVTFDPNSIGNGSIGTKNGAGTVIYDE